MAPNRCEAHLWRHSRLATCEGGASRTSGYNLDQVSTRGVGCRPQAADRCSLSLANRFSPDQTWRRDRDDGQPDSWPVVRLLLHVWGKDFIRREILSGKCSTWRPQETGKLGARGEHFPQDVSRRTRQRPGHFLSFLAKHKKKEVGKSRSQALPDIILSQSLSFSLSKEEKEEIVGRHYVPGETLLGPTKGKRNRRRAKRCFHQERQIPFDSHFFLSI